MCCRKGFSPDR
ncbi:hypothetical protein F383_25317 [Gossypium arboreum]|uniref:Uncharacterized protein n=1 Tax=Gossypium arboreum TaxID=29729 RepID=A0A0B0M7Y9_GOSAR|nr:hypothetical protein F383_37268 [Gossypium arboreum]KHG16944.1 hypothetical protein F383_21269 [Gossypium arboreum]KHG19464.1 hypothetical protein F383_25317 [Gossypium arboreum]